MSEKDGGEATLESASAVRIGDEISGFVNQIRGLASTFPFLLAMSAAGVQSARTQHRKFLQKHAERKEEDGRIFYRVPLDHIPENEKLRTLIARVQHGTDTLPKVFLVSLISEFDSYLSRLIRWYLQKKPQVLEGSEKRLSFSDLTAFDNLDQVVEFLIEKEVETVLRKSHPDQFKWLENKLSIPLTKDLPSWSQFVEICERRNLFVHTNGQVTHQYLKVCADHKCFTDHEVKLGEQLTVTPKYFSTAVNCLIEIGVKLGQVLWRKIDSSDLDNADTNLNNVTYELIVSEKYELAKVLLDFGVNVIKRHHSEQTKRMLLINLAQCYKWIGKGKQHLAIIDSEDWTATAPEYRLCVAVIRDDFELAKEIMTEIGKAKMPGEFGYKTWPVFREFRNSSQFQETYKEIFGEEHEKLKLEQDEDDIKREKLHGAFDLDSFINSLSEQQE